MIAVGVRELKSKLSEYLRLVKSGEVVLITDRGAVVAELRRPGAEAEPTAFPGLNALVREGAVRLGRGDPPADVYAIPDRPQLPEGAALAILHDLRNDG